MCEKKSKLMYLSATLMFAAAVFQITSDNMLTGALMFAAAACFMCAGKAFHKQETCR